VVEEVEPKMANPEKKKPLALEAYEILAESYAARIDEKPENAYLERPATLSLLPDVKGKRVLDCGCGPGIYTEWLVNHGAEVVAFDVSPKMLEFARKRVKEGAEFHLADLGKPLDFLENGKFDLVLCPLCLDYVEDWESIFREFHRTLKPDGIFAFSCEHPFMKFRHTDTDNYYRTKITEIEWGGFDVRVNMFSYYRPLGVMFDALWKAGFVVERFLEPNPVEEFKNKDPGTYEKLMKLPGQRKTRGPARRWKPRLTRQNVNQGE
jgi:SAM-dependent methyltransferase